MTAAAACMLACLSGCCVFFADTSRYDRNSQAYKQCSYEAKVATPSNLSALETIARAGPDRRLHEGEGALSATLAGAPG